MNEFRHKIRRGLAVFLALVMCMSLAMVPAYAVEGETLSDPVESTAPVDTEPVTTEEDAEEQETESVQNQNPDLDEQSLTDLTQAEPVQNEPEPQAEDETDPDESDGSITITDDLQTAINEAKDGATITLGDNITANVVITNKKITLNLNGNTLTGTGKGTVLTINGGEVTLDGNGTITGGHSTDYRQGGGVTVDQGGSFIMKSGKIDNNIANQYGGGVMVYSGTFTMDGGEITNNNVEVSGTGGGVSVYNCIESQSAQFIMNDGTISGNTNGYGGGVGAFHWRLSADRTSVIINGGTITENKATNGGGVSVSTADSGGTEYRGRIEINGGIISGNTASLGGGVYSAESITKIDVAEITGNTATSSTSGGGGVYVQAGSAEINGATITGNSATYGGGLCAGHKDRDTTVIMTSGKLYGNTATSAPDAYCNKLTTLTLPSANTMNGTLNGKPITGWYWSSSGEHAWSKDYCVTQDMTKAVKTHRYLIAAYDLRDPVAKIVETNTEYPTLQAAFDAAVTGQTVEVMRNTTGAKLTTEKSITLNIPADKTISTVSGTDKNGKPYTYALVVANEGAELTITGSGIINGTTYGVVAQSNGTLNVAGCKISGSTAGVYVLTKATATVTGGNLTGEYGLRLASGAAGTVNNGAEVNGNAAAIAVIGPNDSNKDATKLTVNGGTITGERYGIAGSGSSDNTTIEVSGGTITAKDYTAIYHPQVGDMTISGGEITGPNGVQYSGAGKLTISGGTITATMDYTEFPSKAPDQSDGTISDGAALSMVSRGGGWQSSDEEVMNVTVTGGTFVSQNNSAIAVYRVKQDKDTNVWFVGDATNLKSYLENLTITGGTFTGNPEKGVLDIESLAMGVKHITGGYFNQDIDAGEINYVENGYASHPVSTPDGYYNVHTPATSDKYSSNETGHWKGCSGHDDCLEGKTAEAHTWDEGEVTTAPTPTDPGVRTFTCTACGYQRTEPLNHEHSWATAWTTDANNHWHACSVEGCTAVQDSAAHTWGEWVVTTPATTSAPGVETQTCSVCQATQTRPIDQLSGGGGGGGNGGGSSTPTPTPPPTTITDPEVPLAGAPGLNNTDHFAYIAGYTDGTVRPTKNITRAEVATIFLRLMTEDFRVANWSTTHSFTDAGAGEWFNTALAVSAKADILRGYSDGTVKPNAAITRAEFATIAARFLGEDATDEGVGDFSDTGSHWAAKDIRRAAKAGWIKGDGNKFRPNDPITRAEVVTIVNRMLDRIPDAEQMLSDMKTWSDNPVGAWYYADVQEASNDHAYQRGEDGVTEHWTELTAPKDWNALEAAWIANSGASAPKTDGE